MTRASIDRDFDRFRATGDPDALGRVFDAAAPRLVVVAGHLAPGDAEDLVQATFVAAIEQAERYDATRPLWPWLVGILAHEAKALRRRTGRQPDPRRLCTSQPTPPDEWAAGMEVAERVGAAVQALPEPYRQVVALRVVHELEPVQIARVLGIPAETARSRLHRGLARLRAALPAGLAGLTALAMPRSGVAAIRTEVLAAAARLRPLTAAGTSALTLFGVTMSKKLLGVVTAAIIAALAVPLAWRQLADGSPTAPPGSGAELAGAPVDTARIVTPAASGASRNPERTAVPTARPDGCSVHGRIDGAHDDDHREPIAGATVHAVAMRGEIEHALGTATTDPAGRYRIALDALRDLSPLQRETAKLGLRIEANGWIPRTLPADPATIPEARSIELDGTLAPIRGLVVGRVVDVAGQPVADAHVFWKQIDPERRPFRGRDHHGRTATDGTFAVHFDSDGEFALTVGSSASGHAWRPTTSCTADRVHDLGDVVLDPYTTVLSGRLMMRDGTPAAHVAYDVRHVENRALQLIQNTPRAVVIDGALQSVRYLNGATDHDGRFRVAQLEPGRYLVRVRDRFRRPQEFEVGTGEGEHELVLDGQLVTVRVTEATTGPLPGTELIACAWPPERAPDPGRVRRGAITETEPLLSALSVDGADAAVTFLSPWGAVWEFHAPLPGAVPLSVAHRAEPGEAHADVELRLRPIEQLGSIALDVVDERGRPVNHLEASLLFPASGSHAFGSYRREHATADAWDVPPGDWLLRVQPGRPLLGGPAMREHREHVSVAAGTTTPVRIVVQRTGLVRVRLTGPPPPDGAWPQVRATLDDGSGARPVPRLMIRAGDSWLEIPHSTVPADGLAVLRLPLRPGPAILTLTAAGYLPVTQSVQVTADAITDVVVTMLRE